MKLLRIFTLLLLTLFLCAPQTYSAEVINLQTGQQGQLAFAQYDLKGEPGQKDADVHVIIEIGNDKYPGNNISLSGDVGKGVKIGDGRKIFWNVLKDLPAGIDGDVTWDIIAKDPYKPEVTSVNTLKGKGFVDSITGMEFVSVPGGCFKMGDIFNNGDADENPIHNICLNPFLIAKYEVTQSQWQMIEGINPSYFSKCGINCPIESVSWSEVQHFIGKLNEISEKKYRLPTEAEWEFAARSGGRQERYSGSNENAGQVAWYETNGSGKTHPVGQKKANGLGIYDMSGNVSEWISDWKGMYLSIDKNNPTGPNSGINRVLRGGAWLNNLNEQRTSSRSELTPSVRTNSIGFRLVLPVTTLP